MSYLGQGLGLGREERFTATATAGQTTVTTGNDGRSIAYTPNYVDVYLNGSKQVNGSDITVTSGTSIVFASALAAGDVVDVVAPGYFQPADTVSRSLGGTFLGAVNLPSGGLNVGSGQLKVDSSGRVTMSNQPAFTAYNAAANGIGTTTVIVWTNTELNRGGHYNTATGRFTAPVSGVYFFSYRVLTAAGITTQPRLAKNGGWIDGATTYSNPAAGIYAAMSIDVAIQCNAGDYITCGILNAAGEVHTGPNYNSGFSGFLIG